MNVAGSKEAAAATSLPVGDDSCDPRVFSRGARGNGAPDAGGSNAGPEGPRRAGVDEALLGLPFDLFERYDLTRQVVETLRRAVSDGGPLSILDAGGHPSPLKHFTPEGAVALADSEEPGSLTQVPLRFDAYFRASAAALPSADDSSDVVCAHDTLEHIPPPLRAKTLRELVRVSRHYTIVNGPVYEPQVEMAEKRFAGFLEHALGEDSRFLNEHLELGLPTKEDIESAVRPRTAGLVSIPNGKLTVWLTMNAAKSYLRFLPYADDLAGTIERSFNVVFSRADLGGLCYRRAYVAAKQAPGVPALDLLPAPLAAAEVPESDMEALLGAVGAM